MSSVALLSFLFISPGIAQTTEPQRLDAFCHAFMGSEDFARFFSAYRVGMDAECACVTDRALAFETAQDRQMLRSSHVPAAFVKRYRRAILACFHTLARPPG